MSMMMIGRTPPRRQIAANVGRISAHGPYYSTDAGGQVKGARAPAAFGATSPFSIPGFTAPPATGVPAIDQFLQGFGAMLGATTPPPSGLPGVPGLPAFQLPSGVLDLIYAMPIQGMFTPWAAQISDQVWQQISSPTANVAVLDLGLIVGALSTAAVGRPGFIAFLTPSPVPMSLADASFVGTPYRYAGTQAVFSQQDSSSSPKITFLHWGSLRDPADPGGGSGDVNVSAASIGGKAVFALPVSRDGTTMRQNPGTFQTAYKAQFGVSPLMDPGQVLPTSPDPTQPPGTPAPSSPTPSPGEPGAVAPPGGTKQASAWPNALLWGAGATVVAFGVVYVLRSRNKRR